jgi:putative membrane protein
MLKIMEYKLQKFIMTPAMIVSIGAGIVLLITKNIDWTTKWLYIKLIAVSGLVYIHYLLARYRKLFSIDKNTHTKNFYKILNEIPTVLLIIIIIMVYIKPF